MGVAQAVPPAVIHKPGSKRRVMGEVISRIANFLGFGQVSVYTIYINTISSCVLISLCSLARTQELWYAFCEWS